MSETEPAPGSRVVLSSGRTFEHRIDHPEFHWADGIGWYRWSEVQRRLGREGGSVEHAPEPR